MTENKGFGGFFGSSDPDLNIPGIKVLYLTHTNGNDSYVFKKNQFVLRHEFQNGWGNKKIYMVWVDIIIIYFVYLILLRFI
jgi:hypothetical protein